MRSQHMNPLDVPQAFEWLGMMFCAMHRGTIKLTDWQLIDEPPEKIRAYWSSRALAPQRWWVLDVGSKHGRS